MFEVNFIVDDDKHHIKQTGKVKIPFLPRIGDTVILDIDNWEDITHWKVKDILINYEKDFSIRFIEIFVIGII